MDHSLGGDSGTRALVLSCIRRECNTVDEIAQQLGITDNAVRFHMTALERGGLVRRSGVAHTGGAGKPAVIYALTSEGEVLQSRAYAPVLAALVQELGERASRDDLQLIMRSVGERLASGVTASQAQSCGRAEQAAAILEQLGAVVRVSETPDGALIEGYSCPLASAVAREPITCTAVQALLSEVTGSPVSEQCDHGARPRCRFLVPSAAAV